MAGRLQRQRRLSSDEEFLESRERVPGAGSRSVIGDLRYQRGVARKAEASPAHFGVLASRQETEVRYFDRPFTVGTTSILLSPDKPYRAYLLIQNTSGAIMYFSFDKAASVAHSVKINAGGFYESYFRVPTNEIHIVASAVGANGVILEGYLSESVLTE